MSFNGWVKVHRKILDHWVSQEPELFAFWMRLLIEANHSDKKRMFNGALVEIKRGQTLFGLDAFEAKSGISKKRLRRYLDMLETEGMIGRQKTNKYSLISITNYEQYQVEGRQEAGKGQAEGIQRASQGQHLENVKNGENVKNTDIPPKSPKGDRLDYSSWPELPDDQVLKDWIASRKKAKATHSQTAINAIGKELHKAVSMGYTVNECAEEAIMKCWRGFKADWMKNAEVKRGNFGSGLRPSADEPINGDGWAEGFDPYQDTADYLVNGDGSDDS